VKPWIALLLLVPAVAEACPLADALARHNAADVTALRGQRDAGTRCTLGAIYAKRGDLTRAELYLDGCDDSELPEDVAVEIGKIARDTRRALEDSQLAELQILALPEGTKLEATIDALPDETLTTPVVIWIPAGHYEVHATVGGKRLSNVVDAKPHSRSTTIIDPHDQPATVVEPKDTSVDFNEEGAAETTTGPPPDVKRQPLLPCRFTGTCTDAGDALADPLADRATASSHPGWRIGARFGGGMFNGGGDARAGFAAAAVGRLALSGSLFAAARLDWSRRGGSVMADHGIDAVGASAGVGATVLDVAALDLAVTASLRTDVRFESMLDTLPVSRFGLGASVAVDAAIHDTPLAVGLRYEQGLTTLVPGDRDSAVLVELGVDWR
jgi:hypothetical protein